MAYSKLTFNKVRERLMNANDGLASKPGKMPSGAQPTFWMFQFPASPKEHYNEVYPGILIGDHLCAKEKSKLKDIGVTHIVNCAKGTNFNQVNTDVTYYRDIGVTFLGIKAKDIATYDMTPNFITAADFIDKAILAGGKVYVHCMMGISRSATIVIAYLMLKKDMSIMDAVTMVRAKREVFPNDGFLKQLCILDQDLYVQKHGEVRNGYTEADL